MQPINPVEVDGRLHALQQQRNNATDQVVILSGQLAVAQSQLAAFHQKAADDAKAAEAAKAKKSAKAAKAAAAKALPALPPKLVKTAK
jgi:hypothetical protein